MKNPNIQKRRANKQISVVVSVARLVYRLFMGKVTKQQQKTNIQKRWANKQISAVVLVAGLVWRLSMGKVTNQPNNNNKTNIQKR